LITELIAVESVAKQYGPVVAVDNLSLSVTAGEIYGLIGANGAGKSTLMRMIVGITQPDRGHVMLNGEDLSLRGSAPKQALGYLPEELVLYERLTGREFLMLVAGLKGADQSQVDKEIEYFELAQVKSKWAGSYSQGMRKKLGLAAAMLGNPTVLVLDEPLNGLDVEMMRKLRLRIEAEREGGRAILVSSHVMSFVERVCDRVGIMQFGKLIAEGTPDEIRLRTGLANEPFEDVFFRLTQR